MRISSFNHCILDATARVDSECTMTKVTLGRFSYVGTGTRMTDVIVGGFSSIGARCGIGGGVHPTETVSTSPVFFKGHNILEKNFAEIHYEPSTRVEIGNDVWIGEGVCIISGVKIGDGAVIGAHAVVTKDVEPYTVMAGIPAKPIRRRFDEDTILKLLELKWWNWTEADLKKYGRCFNSPQTLFESIAKEKVQSIVGD